ncbi:MAG: hypothetical protein OHK0056_16200 [Bacteriovoracaceae bacterium]
MVTPNVEGWFFEEVKRQQSVEFKYEIDDGIVTLSGIAHPHSQTKSGTTYSHLRLTSKESKNATMIGSDVLIEKYKSEQCLDSKFSNFARALVGGFFARLKSQQDKNSIRGEVFSGLAISLDDYKRRVISAVILICSEHCVGISDYMPKNEDKSEIILMKELAISNDQNWSHLNVEFDAEKSKFLFSINKKLVLEYVLNKYELEKSTRSRKSVDIGLFTPDCGMDKKIEMTAKFKNFIVR